MSVDRVDRSNQLARANATCIKCKGENKTGYTMCESCSEKSKCQFPGCTVWPSKAVMKFSEDVYRKVLCWDHQPAQIREAEMKKEVNNNE